MSAAEIDQPPAFIGSVANQPGEFDGPLAHQDGPVGLLVVPEDNPNDVSRQALCFRVCCLVGQIQAAGRFFDRFLRQAQFQEQPSEIRAGAGFLFALPVQFPEVYRPPNMRQPKFGLADLKTVPGNVGVALRGEPIVAPRLGISKDFA